MAKLTDKEKSELEELGKKFKESQTIPSREINEISLEEHFEEGFKRQVDSFEKIGFSKGAIKKFIKLCSREKDLQMKEIQGDWNKRLKILSDMGSIQAKKLNIVLDHMPEQPNYVSYEPKPDDNPTFLVIDSYLSAIEKAERPKGLFNLLTHDNKDSFKLSDREYWEMIIDTWIMCEAQTYTQDKMFWGMMLKILKPIEELKGTLKEVPKEFVAYRGGNVGGFSYTTKLKTAKWFQNRYGEDYGSEIPILKRKTKREEVLFYENSRNEFEIVLNPDCVEQGNEEI